MCETEDLFIPPLDGHIPSTHEVNATRRIASLPSFSSRRSPQAGVQARHVALSVTVGCHDSAASFRDLFVMNGRLSTRTG